MRASHVMQYIFTISYTFITSINPLNAELNPICHLLVLLGDATIVVVSRLRVKNSKILSRLHTQNGSLYPCPYMYEHSTVLYGEPPP